MIRPADRDWQDLAREVVLMFPNLIKLLGRLLRDPRVPMRRKAIAGIAVGYIVSPIDLVPDFIPVVGQVDDVLIVAYAIHHLIEGAGFDVVAEHWDGEPESLELIDAVVAWGADLVPPRVRRLLS